MEKYSITAIIFDENDANFFLKTKPAVTQVLSITLNAKSVLSKIDIKHVNTTNIYTDCSHARVLARVRRMERYFLEDLKHQDNLSLSTKEFLRSKIHIISSISASFWELVKGLGKSLLPVDNNWIQVENPRKTHKLLMKHLRNKIEKKIFLSEISLIFCPQIINFFNELAFSIRKRQKIIFFSDFNYGLKKLTDHKDFKMFAISIRYPKGNWEDIFHSLKFIWDSLLKKKTSTIIVMPKYFEESSLSVQNLLKRINDPITSSLLEIVNDSLIKSSTLYDGSLQYVKKIINRLKPHQIIAGQLRWWSGPALGEAGKTFKIPVTLISHGSHHLNNSPIAKFEQKEHANGLLFSSLSDVNLMQSPHAEAFAKKFNIKNGLRYKPIQWGNSTKKVTNSSEMRYILHAGTYKQWLTPRPWIYETPDEYINGLKYLILATSNLKKTKLIIRLRVLPDCSLTNLKDFLPDFDHYEIKSSGDFNMDMSAADLLVSWSSTTIEEALHMRKPVLLWGGSNRYFHLPPCRKPPSNQKRSAVYTPEKKENLSDMIKKILDFHKGIPLTDKELKSHMWPEDIPGIDEFISDLKKEGYFKSKS